MKELDTIRNELLLGEYKDSFVRNWKQSEQLLNTTDILSEKHVTENAKLAGIDDGFIPHIVTVAEEIVSSVLLKRVFIHTYYLLFICQDSTSCIISDFPDMQEVLNDDSFTYNLLLVLSGIKQSEDYFSSMNMPKDVMKGAIQDVSIWVKYFYNELGVIGINPKILNWEHRLMRGHFFRLGRLQFNICPFYGKVLVFRNKVTNYVQAIMERDIIINSSGQFDGVDGFFDNNSWKTVMERDEKQVIGNPVTPEGNVLRNTLCLKLNEWDEVLTPGDPILNIHIPAGRDFNIQTCADSINYALEFFPKYFPKKTFKGWACNSWFLDNQYEKILTGRSNILEFQRELYLYPSGEGAEESYKRVFGENGIKDGIGAVPRNSSMQRAVAEFIEKGGRLRAGGGFFLKQDMPWGEQIYRQSYLMSLKNIRKVK